MRAMSNKFSKWYKWNHRKQIHDSHYPGIYILVVSPVDLSGKHFDWDLELSYIGMTNSKKGLAGRLRQFDNTIKGKKGHGGAARFRFVHQDYDLLADKLYVSVCAFPCDPSRLDPSDLEVMGEVAKFEYICFANHKKKYGRIPYFNLRSSKKHK